MYVEAFEQPLTGNLVITLDREAAIVLQANLLHEPGVAEEVIAAIDRHLDDPRKCGFCQGQPVFDAAEWIDGKPRPPAPCPRCGVTTMPLGPGWRVVNGEPMYSADWL